MKENCKICNKCKKERKVTDFSLNQSKCKICSNIAVKEWVAKNKEKSNTHKKTYRDKNKEKSKLYDSTIRNRIVNKERENELKKKRRREDPVYKFKTNIKESVRKAFFKINKKKSKRTEEILGCSVDFFRHYIENKFEPWMNWNNNGKYNKKIKTWQLDHIIPISLAITENDAIKLSHYTNFQPLESFENMIKSNNI